MNGVLPTYSYRVYGITVHSRTPLSLPAAPDAGNPAITLDAADSSWFTHKLDGIPIVECEPDWYRFAHLPDGSIYVRWEGWFHFLISPDGRQVTHGLLARASDESFEAYLLSQALSFGLVQQGHEPLHVTCVVRDDVAIGFMGRSGLGKSTLAAGFVASGWRLLTDDLLLISADTLLAQPGPHRIKLFPAAALRLLRIKDLGTPMNPDSEKRVIALSPDQRCDVATPAHRLYALSFPDSQHDCEKPRIDAMTEPESFLHLLGSTFNSRIRTRERLKRQFEYFTHLARSVPVKRLTYAREMSRVGEVRDAVLADLAAR